MLCLRPNRLSMVRVVIPEVVSNREGQGRRRDARETYIVTNHRPDTSAMPSALGVGWAGALKGCYLDDARNRARRGVFR
jgi:hypothetical protein